MSALTPDTVASLASLARISLSDEERERLAQQLDVILDAVAQVQGAVGPDVPATSHPMPLVNVTRPDVVQPGLTPEQALSGAPAVEQQRFRVPQILEDEE